MEQRTWVSRSHNMWKEQTHLVVCGSLTSIQLLLVHMGREVGLECTRPRLEQVMSENFDSLPLGAPQCTT